MGRRALNGNRTWLSDKVPAPFLCGGRDVQAAGYVSAGMIEPEKTCQASAVLATRLSVM